MSNAMRQELQGKTVLVSKKRFLDPENTTDEDRTFLCEAGFGCSPNTNGEKIFGKWVKENEDGVISGREVESIVNEK